MNIKNIHKQTKFNYVTILILIVIALIIIYFLFLKDLLKDKNTKMEDKLIVAAEKYVLENNITTSREIYLDSSKLDVILDDDACKFLAEMSSGDARTALNALELGALTTDRSDDGKIHITMDVASECIQKRALKYDKDGDNHYDTISAFIKSMRGSDPDAATYYLARMLSAGEDIKFIARRIMICAAEDVGLADPNALNVAVSAALAVERVGMPESQIILSEAVNYIATAPKSNSCVNAIYKAMDIVSKNPSEKIPPYLQDAHYGGSAKLGRGIGYKYPHDFENHYVDQQYLPDGIMGETIFEPSGTGYEKEIIDYFNKIKGKDKNLS